MRESLFVFLHIFLMKGQAAACIGLSVIGADRLVVVERGMRRLMDLEEINYEWTMSVIEGTDPESVREKEELDLEELEIKGKIKEIKIKSGQIWANLAYII